MRVSVEVRLLVRVVLALRLRFRVVIKVLKDSSPNIVICK